MWRSTGRRWAPVSELQGSEGQRPRLGEQAAAPRGSAGLFVGLGPPALPLGALRQPREAAEGPKSHMVVFYDGKGLYQAASPVYPSEEPQVSSFRTLSWIFPGEE